MIPLLNVDLSLSPRNRWSLTPQQIDWAQSLVHIILDEIGGVDPYRDLIEFYAAKHINASIEAELASISEQCSRSYLEILTANLHYDFVKLLFGCTAFAVNTPNGPLHARNMDWVSQKNCLSEFTTITSFKGERSFQSVGWPGFAGVFSSVAPGRFTVTMNAALSSDPQVPGDSIAILIRDTLETCTDFAAAIAKLSRTTITSDCLLLVTGPHADEMLVIERTPTKHAFRYPTDNQLVLTNDFRVLAQPKPPADSLLYNSTCSRFDATLGRLAAGHPTSVDDCFAILNHPGVRMSITVQQMVMSSRSGELIVRTQHTG
jgi:acid ceramidase